MSLPLAVLLVLAAPLELVPRGWALAAETKRISVNSSEAQANGASSSPSTSAGGRFVVFYSDATNLVGGDTNGVVDIFVRDRSTGRTRRVSVSSAGEEANGESDTSSISADGRFVAFLSHATNLVGGDTNGDADIFVRDRSTGRTRRVSVSSDEAQGNGPSADPVISADGRIVAFSSHASNLVGGDSNSTTDVFVRVRKAGTTTRVSVSSGAAGGNSSSAGPDLSAGGRFVVFASSATNLVGNDTNGYADVFLHDLKNDTTRRVSITSGGAEGNALSNSPSISANGLVVAFRSPASNLVGNDANAAEDVFVRDRAAGTTRRMSVNSAGDQGNGRSYAPSISANGRYVAFNSAATDLVGKDTNAIDDVFIRGPLR